MLRNMVIVYFLSLSIIFPGCAGETISIEKTSAIGTPEMVGNLSSGRIGNLLNDGIPVAVNRNFEAALFTAAAKGDIGELKSLLAEGININEKNEKGETALMLAAFNNRIKFAKLLLEKGADVNMKDEDGHTALFFALKRGKFTMVKLLKQAGAKD